ncbi:MAG: hypothetical protein UW11_C0041G0013, partial [Parcubacteria group bacterium GW2011_GWA2_43_9b]
LLAKVLELQRHVGDRFLHQRDHFLQRVFLGPGYPHGVSLYARLRLHLAVLEQLDDFPGKLLLDADAHCDRLLDRVAAGFFYRSRRQRAHVDAAFRQLGGQHVAHLAELEVVVRKHHQDLVFVLILDFDARIRALEIEAVGNLLVALVDRIPDFDLIHFGNDIKRWHGSSFACEVTGTPAAVAGPGLAGLFTEVAHVVERLQRLDIERALRGHAETVPGAADAPVRVSRQLYPATAGDDFHEFGLAGLEIEHARKNHADASRR